jgi:hypothetical protein
VDFAVPKGQEAPLESAFGVTGGETEGFLSFMSSGKRLNRADLEETLSYAT